MLSIVCTYTLIQNQKADLGKTEFTSRYEIIQSARCSHNDINLGLKRPHKIGRVNRN